MLEQLRMGLSGAYMNLCRAKVRTLLSTMGFVLGSACIVTISNVGSASKEQADTNFLAMQPDIWVLRSGLDRPESNEKLDRSSLATVTTAVPEVESAALASFQLVVSQSLGTQKTSSLATYSTELAHLLRTHIALGRTFSAFDLGQKTIVVGSDYSNQFGSSSLRPGSSVHLGSSTYLVVGVLAPQVSPAGLPYTINDTAFILRAPETAASLAGLQGLDTAVVRVRSLQDPEKTKAKILEHFRQAGGTQIPNVVIPERLYAIMNTQGSMLSNLLRSTAAIAIFLGAASMLNLMLTAVRERRKEIGIRLAIGARPRDILTLFLCEASMLSAVGGVLGSTLGSLGSLAFEHYFEMPGVVTPGAFLLGIAVALLAGISAGGYPAWRGSRMDPLEGLMSH